MKDYIRRSAKFILYIVALFFLILCIFPLISQGKPMSVSIREMLSNSRFTLVFGMLIVYGMFYPMAVFSTVKRHLNGSFEDNREKFERAFSALNYIKTEETTDTLVYRKKTAFARLAQWNEDSITIYKNENPVIISGFRRWIIRLDRMMDQYIRQESA